MSCLLFCSAEPKSTDKKKDEKQKQIEKTGPSTKTVEQMRAERRKKEMEENIAKSENGNEFRVLPRIL